MERRLAAQTATRFSSSLPVAFQPFELQNSATPELLAAHSKNLLQPSFRVSALLLEVGLITVRSQIVIVRLTLSHRTTVKIFNPPTVTMASAAAAGERTCYNCKSGSILFSFTFLLREAHWPFGQLASELPT
jgi:hypothetical protein